MSWDPITSNTGLTPTDLNKVFNRLQGQIDALNASTDGSVTVYNATNCSGLNKGQLVAFVGGSFVPAQPTWTLDAITGHVVPSTQAYVVGMVYTAPDTNGGAQIAIAGVIRDTDLIPAGSAGAYYLAADGAQQLNPPNGMLPVFCGYKTQANMYVLRPNAPEYAGHRHTEYTLTSGTYTSGGNTYNFTNDPLCSSLVTAIPNDAIVATVANKVTGVSVSGSILTFTDITAGSGDVLSGAKLFVTNSLVSADGAIRAVAPADGNATIKVTKAFGTVYLDNDYPITNVGNGGTCVAGISRGGVTVAPVINQINGAGGINATTSNGICMISDVTSGTYIDFQTINANNVLIGATANDALITFPEGVNASLLGIVRLPPRQEGSWTFQIYTWAVDSNTALNVSATMLIPTSGGSYTTSSGSGTTNNGSFTAPGGTLVQATLYNSGTAVRLQAAGAYIIS